MRRYEGVHGGGVKRYEGVQRKGREHPPGGGGGGGGEYGKSSSFVAKYQCCYGN